ncbi:hypothetical protein Tco_1235579 [Tanacetum coccineum]
MIQTASHLSPDTVGNIQTSSLEPSFESSSIFIPVSYLVREGSGVTPKVLDGLSHKGLNEGSGVNKEVSDELMGSSSCSSSKSEDEEILLTTNDDANPHKSDAKKKDKEMEDIDEQTGKYHAMDEQAVNVQDEMSIPKPQVEKPVVPHPNSNPAEIEIQSMVEVPVLQENPPVQRPPLVDATITLIQETTQSPKRPLRKKKQNKCSPLKKRKKRKSKDTEPSMNDKDTASSLKKARVQDADWAADDMPHDDVAPKQDNSKWFKHPVVERAESLDPEWHKEPNANDAY